MCELLPLWSDFYKIIPLTNTHQISQFLYDDLNTYVLDVMAVRRRYMAENCRYGVNLYPINQSINQYILL